MLHPEQVTILSRTVEVHLHSYKANYISNYCSACICLLHYSLGIYPSTQVNKVQRFQTERQELSAELETETGILVG